MTWSINGLFFFSRVEDGGFNLGVRSDSLVERNGKGGCDEVIVLYITCMHEKDELTRKNKLYFYLICTGGRLPALSGWLLVA